jgi:hypothetical protein
MMRYGLNAAIIAGAFCLTVGEPARTTDESSGDYLPVSREMTPPASLYLEDDIHFHEGRSKGGVKLHLDARRVARDVEHRPRRYRRFEVALS